MPKKVNLSAMVNPKTGLPLLNEQSKLLFQPRHGLVYWLVAQPAFFIARILFLPKANGLQNIPKDGGFVIAFNHIANLDSVLVSATARRQLHFLAKIELSRGWKGKILNGVGIVPIDRDRRNSEALGAAVQVLKKGGVVALAPEGRTNRSEELAPFKFGAVAMAGRAKVPIVPAVIVGRYLPFRRKISITYGKPMKVNANDLEAANEKLWYTINNMREKIRRGRG
jgi:1-acyl-sn-glycerol-3-phosphate acyltransferase